MHPHQTIHDLRNRNNRSQSLTEGRKKRGREKQPPAHGKRKARTTRSVDVSRSSSWRSASVDVSRLSARTPPSPISRSSTWTPPLIISGEKDPSALPDIAACHYVEKVAIPRLNAETINSVRVDDHPQLLQRCTMCWICPCQADSIAKQGHFVGSECQYHQLQYMYQLLEGKRYDWGSSKGDGYSTFDWRWVDYDHPWYHFVYDLYWGLGGLFIT